MSYSEGTTGTQVFYTFLKFKTRIFCDEKDKKQFLDFALSHRKKEGETVLAFTVLDDEFHFLIRKNLVFKDRKWEEDRIRETERFLERVLFSGRRVNVREKGWQRLFTTEEIQKVCRYIHRLSLEQGYAENIKDYWWSSYQTYRGGYLWEGLDVSFVPDCFSKNPEEGRSLFLKYHRRES